MLLNAMAKQRIRKDNVFQKARDEAILKIDRFNSQDLAMTANAYARMNFQKSRAFRGDSKGISAYHPHI